MNLKLNKINQWWQSFPEFSRICWLVSITALIIINFLAFLYHLGSTGLVDETEPLFAESARQMTVTNNWITPYFNNETRFDKPPLIYWLMAISYKILGVNEWAARLPSAISAIILTCFTFYILRFTNNNLGKNKDNNLKIKWLSSWLVIFITSFNIQTLIWARTGVSDMLLNACMGSSLICFFRGYITSEKPHLATKTEAHKIEFLPNNWYLACYIFTALAILAKGPVGIVIPGLIIFSFLFYTGNFWQVIKESKFWLGMIIIALITLPWYILVILENGENYINSFFYYHNIERFTSVVNSHDAPWWFYFPVVLIGFFPWSIYLPIAIGESQFWKRKLWQKQPRHQQLQLFAFFWFIIIFLFFTIAVTKLPSYTLPLIPAGSILVAIFWSNILVGDEHKLTNNKFFLSSLIANIILLLSLGVAFMFIPNWIGYDPVVPNLAEIVKNSGLPVIGGLIWIFTAIISLFLLSKKLRKSIILVNIIGFLFFFHFLVIPTAFLLDNLRQLPLREASQTIVEFRQPQEEILSLGTVKPSLTFYTQNYIHFLKTADRIKNFIQENRYQKYPVDSFIVLTRNKYIKRMNLQPEDYQVLNQHGVYYVLRIKQDIMWNVKFE